MSKILLDAVEDQKVLIQKRLDEILKEIEVLKTKDYPEIVDHYFDKINSGYHVMSDRMKSDLGYKLLYSIISFQVGVPTVIDKVVNSVEQLNELYQSYTSHLTINCDACKEFINFHPSGTNPRELYMIRGEDDKYAKCFDYGIKKYKFKTTSDKLILANDNLRKYIKVENHFEYYSVDNIKSVEELTNSFINNNVTIGYIGCSSINLYKENNEYIIISDNLEEYWFNPDANDEDEDSKASLMQWVEENGSIEMYEQADKLGLINKDSIGSIWCGLWGFMATDKDNIDYEKLISDGEEFIELDVKPNTEYIFEVDYKPSADFNLYSYKIYEVK